jgi:hypothetical protein
VSGLTLLAWTGQWFTLRLAASGAGRPTLAVTALEDAATGVSGTASVAALVVSVSRTAWPWISAVVGLATIALGIAVLVSSRRWPGSSRRYQPVQFEPTEPGANPVSDWDTLSGGTDPTSR